MEIVLSIKSDKLKLITAIKKKKINVVKNQIGIFPDIRSLSSNTTNTIIDKTILIVKD